MSISFKSVYTVQKHKKQGVIWKDGTVILNIEEKKLTLKDEENAILTTYRIKAKDVVEEGSDIDIGKYLISIDSEIGSSSAADQIKKPPPIAPRARVLLKRNSTFVSPFARKKVNINQETERKSPIVANWETYKKRARSVILENVQILLYEKSYRLYKNLERKSCLNNFERACHYSGLSFYDDCTISRSKFSNYNSDTPIESNKYSDSKSIILNLSRKDKSSKYNKGSV
ncbi:hypothetical protein AYI70_g9073 [Smittium culicis]|uniref:5'-3' DNA helicase ZGRF1-like N-terminal domain-containing protein n=1 Tax=Smittium culicis TaxID=133412 RepID=A0A1R1XCY0_9FUNG|nr:hypothetical protein AYI70_g9073 [Smittium culicis]